jgi:hypothetical protein
MTRESTPRKTAEDPGMDPQLRDFIDRVIVPALLERLRKERSALSSDGPKAA